jgi:uncharacterized protein YcfJ
MRHLTPDHALFTRAPGEQRVNDPAGSPRRTYACHMKLLGIALFTMATGCSTVKGAASALTGGRPHQVTVVNNIDVPHAPAPAPQVVVVQQEAPRTSRVSQLKAAGAGALAGAALGTAVGYAMGGNAGARKGAALGAGAGAVGGYVASEGK